MAVVINGSGTVTGISVGGLPDDIVDSGTLADDAVVAAAIADDAVVAAALATDSVTADALEVSAIARADLPAGAVLQVVSASVDGNATSTSTSFAATSAAQTITPTAATSKFLVSYMGGRTGFSGSGGGDGAIKLYRTISGGSATSVEAAARGISNFYGFGDFYAPTALQWIDDPDTALAITYTVYKARRSGTGTFSLSRD